MMKFVVDKGAKNSAENQMHLRTDFIKFINSISNPNKDGTNVYSKYVKLPTILSAIKKQANKLDMAFTQDITRVVDKNTGREGIGCYSILIDKYGEIVSSPMPISIDQVKGRTGSQAFGSSYTYVKRYSAETFCGIAGKDDDDDGNASSNGGEQSGSRFNNSSNGRYRASSTKSASDKQVSYLDNLISSTASERHSPVSKVKSFLTSYVHTNDLGHLTSSQASHAIDFLNSLNNKRNPAATK